MILPLYTNYQTKHVRVRTTSMRNIENIAKKKPAEAGSAILDDKV